MINHEGKVLNVGASGFIGRAVSLELANSGYEVIKTGHSHADGYYQLNALNFEEVQKCITEVMPEVIVNCAGIVQNSEEAAGNVKITMNILRAIVGADLRPRRIIITGSAAEYGKVDKLPVSEDAPIRPFSDYGQYKSQEVAEALSFAENNDLEVIVARLFNPIGSGMAERQLIPSLLRQLKLNPNSLEISRLDSLRDYVDIREVARAYRLLVDAKQLKHSVYNIGSGIATSNGQLINIIISALGIHKPEISETSTSPEDRVASQADISRIVDEFGWEPKLSLIETITEIIKNEQSAKTT
jgi:GDP-4-dehydro-6-deoxy-D-mannose reductase